MNKYDSSIETQKHIDRVQALVTNMACELIIRGSKHDASKLQSPEKELFDIATPSLAKMTYGSDEYKKMLEDLKPALEHHYAENSHHPENRPEGISGMTLVDLLEMICDWKAASERHENGNIYKSLEINKTRFKIEPQLAQILENTVAQYLQPMDKNECQRKNTQNSFR